jgi:hypothetical protein
MPSRLLAIDDTTLHLSIVRKIATQAGFGDTGACSIDKAAGLAAQAQLRLHHA